MPKKSETRPDCLVCDEPAIDIARNDFIITVQCIDCGMFDILELAAEHIRELPIKDRRALLDRAKRVGEYQDGPPLIREPFQL